MTDDRIVELFWQRDERAIAETQNRYGQYLRTVAGGILADESACEEVVNDTYVKAWNCIPPQRPDTLKGFLARITRQISINRLKENTRLKRGGGRYELPLEELSGCLPDTRSGDLAETTALRDALNLFLRQLSQEKRRVFIRRYWYMDTVSQIAAQYGISESKVKSMLMRTREQLRQFLEKEGISL